MQRIFEERGQLYYNFSILSVFYFRSETDGSCLYSSVSLALVGNNSLSQNLRVLTSLELFLHTQSYYKHPCLVSVFNNHKEICPSYISLVPLVLCHDTLDSGLSGELLLQHEALLNCTSMSRQTGFFCILAISSVINRYFYILS